MKYAMLCSIMIFAALTAFLPPASFTVKGKVTDSAGAILAGVSVTEKGTANITQTNASGDFAITVSSTNATLVFSSIDFEDKEIKVSGKSVLNVQLSHKAHELDEVVVTGYEGTRRKNLTGSAQREAKADIALQGRTAGVVI